MPDILELNDSLVLIINCFNSSLNSSAGSSLPPLKSNFSSILLSNKAKKQALILFSFDINLVLGSINFFISSLFILSPKIYR